MDLIQKVYNVLKSEINDDNVSEFWQLILTIFGEKPAYLNQAFSNEKMKKVQKLLNNSKLYFDDDEWVLSNVFADKSYYEQKVDFAYQNISKSDPDFLYKAYGIILDYPCSGDRRQLNVPFTFINFIFIPNENYKKLFKGTNLYLTDDLLLYSIGCYKPKKADFENIAKNYNKFFENMDLGHVVYTMKKV